MRLAGGLIGRLVAVEAKAGEPDEEADYLGVDEDRRRAEEAGDQGTGHHRDCEHGHYRSRDGAEALAVQPAHS